MRTPPRILVADDNPANVDILRARLTAQGYEVVTAADGEAALAVARTEQPDLILLDVMMPKLDGTEVCRRLRADAALPFMPIVMVTAKADSKDVVAGLEAGADEYLTKPVDQAALVARVNSMLRIKALHDTVRAQAADLEQWNRTLEQRVCDQVAELDRLSRLRRFLAPQVAEVILGAGDDASLETQRREVTVVHCDLGQFTAFAETAEPEEAIAVLREFHAEVGPLIFDHQGTLERFLGDGVLVVFNAPVPCPDPAARAVRMALAIRQRTAELRSGWRKRGHELGLGIGIAHGYATLGTIGFDARSDYVAFGRVVILANLLCRESEREGEVLLDQRAYTAVEDLVEADGPREYTPRGFQRPVAAYSLRRLRG